MDIAFTEEELAFQQEVSDFLDEAWPEEMRRKYSRNALENFSRDDRIAWQQRLAKKGWAAINWPTEHGGAGFSHTQKYLFDLELARAGAPAMVPMGVSMVAHVIMKFGTDEQKQKYLPDILHSRTFWCQGYSEPGSGSDLASLSTKAEDHGDHYLVNGVKTWNTLGQHADMIFCLVRTSQEAKRQMGISFLLIDMKSPGITVEPIITMDQPKEGFQEINTVYFEDVQVPKENLVGEEGKGWTCAKYLLEFERGNAQSPGLYESLNHVEWMARETQSGAGTLFDDGDFRDRFNDLKIQTMAMEATEMRILGSLSAGQNVGPELSLLKTRGSEISQAISELAGEVAGYYGIPLDQSTPLDDDDFIPAGPDHFSGVSQKYFNLRKTSIDAGSNEIQRNIMAKLVLGLE